MFIAHQLKQKNIAEYLLYMWQVEDLIRAYQFDLDRIKEKIVNPYPVDDAQKGELLQWYADLIDMMRQEGVMEKGHLQINRNVVVWLTDLHLQLLKRSNFPFYNAAYYKALPFIVELRNKSNHKEEPELETCFDALYGVMLLKLQQKQVSDDTQKAVQVISSFLSMLANYYDKDKKGELKLDE